VELLRDHLRVGAHALGMAARLPIVHAQRGHEAEKPLCGLGRRIGRRAGARIGEPALEIRRRAGAECRAKSRRCLVGEHQRELEQRGEREQPARQPVEPDQHGRGAHGEPDPPRRERDIGAPGRPDEHAREMPEGNRCGNRREQDEPAQKRSDPGVRLPARAVVGAVLGRHERASDIGCAGPRLETDLAPEALPYAPRLCRSRWMPASPALRQPTPQRRRRPRGPT
jgi:hypothetical protein